MMGIDDFWQMFRKFHTKTVTEIKNEPIFGLYPIGYNPTRWALGWYRETNSILYFRKAEISRQPNGQWYYFVHIYGHPMQSGFEPNRILAMEKCKELITKTRAEYFSGFP